MKQLALVVSVSATVLVALGAGLRPDAFYAGDPGIKLIAARAVLSHPYTPFDISLPTIGADVVPSVEPFFSVHGLHRHAVTSSIFPAASAPFLLAFGMRGLYVLPGLGFLLALAGCGWMATGLDRRRSSALAAAAAALATPFAFYGLEFWEHMPAVGCAAAATALLVRGRAFASGLLLGVAVLLRPEAAWFGAAVLIAGPLLPRRTQPHGWGLALSGAIVAMVPYAIYTLVHFGTLVPPHVTANAAVLGAEWMSARKAIAAAWFLPGSNANIWPVAPVVAIAGASLWSSSTLRGRSFLWAVAVIDTLLVVATAPNDGGAQWGPRYLLVALVPLAVLAADAVQNLPRRSLATAAAIAAVVLWCAWVQRSAYRQLQGTKAMYGRVVDFVASETTESSHIVTNVWWLDQIAAAAIGDRQIFYAPEEDTGKAIVRRLSDATVPVVTVVGSRSESADTLAWSAGTCYFEERRDSISTRDLVAVQLRHRCPAGP